MLLCINCGKPNDPKENYCVHCGASMPKLAYGMDMGSVHKVDKLYYKFKDAVDKVKNNESTLEEYKEFLVNMQETLHQKEQEIRDLEIDESIMDDFVEEMEFGLQGVDTINQAMETMLCYLQEQNPEFLDNGLELVEEGLEYIHRARIINHTRDQRLSAEIFAQYQEEKSIEM